ncbi:MAG: type 1 glutamine amidotransferase domain-containing protein, partial [Ekhidna sp.]
MNYKNILKIVSLTILVLLISFFVFGYWFIGLIKDDKHHKAHNVENTLPSDLAFLTIDSIKNRGKVLAVVTSTAEMGTSGKSTGYELTELSRAYYVFQANGFEVDVASPEGGTPPVVIDDDDVDIYDFAFLNDPIAQYKTHNTISLSEVNIDEYEAVYFVGGKGAMYDFPDNQYIQSLVREYFESGKIIGAVCHGPAALVNVKLSDDEYMIEGKKMSSFTNDEELFLIPEALTIFPFLLQSELSKRGALFSQNSLYLENVVHDENLITGQNPWSTWELAETMIAQMGYTPKMRQKTAEEI